MVVALADTRQNSTDIHNPSVVQMNREDTVHFSKTTDTGGLGQTEFLTPEIYVQLEGLQTMEELDGRKRRKQTFRRTTQTHPEVCLQMANEICNLLWMLVDVRSRANPR